MTKLYKNTGIEYEITYPPPPEPPPPAPDPEVAAPPGDNVDSDSPSGNEPVDKSERVTYTRCVVIDDEGDRWPGIQKRVGGAPAGPCMKLNILDYEG